ncbi:heme NO-binding domain-containing protein [Lentibacter algarum]|uniref:heme NO-binding domain-containing protein n=1 Tax=Lentibacter algarum TaxID=576131 RepID=UPI001C070B21|nr:heme NO-binding domain-containing protein [Lentibacter algarum]MBU2981831.1 heme NO-binding domain-containing protein [Lentibacter algarum]
MHGLINRTIQCFAQDTYDASVWGAAVAAAGLKTTEFEAMLAYDDSTTLAVLKALSDEVGTPSEVILEDIGTYLVTHKNCEAVRRLLRFGGVDFIEFLHSLDDLPDRTRLAVAELELPKLELREHSIEQFSVSVEGRVRGFAAVLMGVLRAMADDYGALVFLERLASRSGVEIIEIRVIETAFAAGRGFELGVRTG